VGIIGGTRGGRITVSKEEIVARPWVRARKTLGILPGRQETRKGDRRGANIPYKPGVKNGSVLTQGEKLEVKKRAKRGKTW